MIAKKCFTSEWLNEVSDRLKYRDKNLIEKVVRALSLLEMLVASGCPLIFKGGTALMLILKGSLHRLSIDIDVICPPGTNIEEYLRNIQEHGFISYDQDYKENAGRDIPVSHAKVFYHIAYTDLKDVNEFIRLDVLYENNPYSNTTRVAIDTPFVELEGEPLMVTVPAKEDILGDKITAFAPNTIGIPYYKGERNCNMEIIKQLYDINRLFLNVDDFSNTYKSFKKVSEVELGYRNLSGRLSEYFDDVRQTALCIATRGLVGKGDFKNLQMGINRVKSFMYKDRYYIEQAIVDASRAAYLATCLEKGFVGIEKFSGNVNDVVDMDISDTLPSQVRRLKTISPEAFWYWVKVSELL